MSCHGTPWHSTPATCARYWSVFRYGIPLVCTLLHVYVGWRAGSVPAIQRRVPRRWLIGGVALLWATCLAGRLIGHHGSGPVAAALELFGMSWLAALLLTAVALLGVELVTGFGWLLRRRAPTLRGCALIGGAALSIMALVQGLRAPAVRAHEVRLAGLPAALDGTVVVALADLHLGNLIGARWLAARVKQIEQQRPDLVLLLGDIFEGHDPVRDELAIRLRRLTAPLGVFAVTGNHDDHGDDDGVRRIAAAGPRVLNDRHVQVRPGLILAGVNDLGRRRRQPTGEIVTRVLERAPPGALVLLSHRPLHAAEAAAAGADLMLAGHTHGGQIWPLGYLVRLGYPLLTGRFQVRGMTVIVTRGAGTWGPRMRLWHRGEILRITLRASPAG